MRYAQPPAPRGFDASVFAGWAQAWSHLFVSIGRRGLDDGRAVVDGLCSARTASEVGKIVAPSVAAASSNWLAVVEASVTLAGNQASQLVQSLAMAAPGSPLKATLAGVGQTMTDISLATAEVLSVQRACFTPLPLPTWQSSRQAPGIEADPLLGGRPPGWRKPTHTSIEENAR